ncbi:matrix metalloproteinase-17-like, partial [Cetorhinus maximus]
SWLTSYGYLPPLDEVTGQLQTWDSVTKAIESMQEFAGINVTGIIDEATLNVTRTPRCSIPDILPDRGRRTRTSPAIWAKRNLSWKIRRYPADPSLDRVTIRALMFYSLKIWSQFSSLHFHEVQGERADMEIDFPVAEHGDSYPFDGSGGVIGHAFHPGEHPMAGRVHFDGEETWTFRSTGDRGTDLFSVALHEFGHALGLSHSASPSSIMCPYYRGPVGDPLRYQLEPSDRIEIERLYGPRESLDYEDAEIGNIPSQLPSLPEPRGTGPSVRPSPQDPERCRTSFNAAAQIRGETFFFKGRYFWRLGHSGHLTSLRPTRISRFWRGLPGNLERVDAVYERQTDHNILFFTGSQYWIFKDNRLQDSSPRPLSEFGLPVSGIDAVFTVSVSQKTYFIRDAQLWVYNEREKGLDPGFPRESWPWTEIPRKIDSALTWTDGAVYFLSGREVWRYEGGGNVLSPGYPRPLGPHWLDCEGSAEERGGPQAGPSVGVDTVGEVGEVCVCGSGSLGLDSGRTFSLLLVTLGQGLRAAISV